VKELIRLAESSADFEAFAGLILQFRDWVCVRYRDLGWFVGEVFGHQALEDELLQLSTRYARPNGRAFLAIDGGQACGAAAWHRLDDGCCEMKRVFVRDQHQGRGIGRRLCTALIESARADGYRTIRLDTGDRLAEAIAMYRSLGFAPCAPYHAYPARVMQHVVFMETVLQV
jgi:GNAT superfamily N-acetyltransferase